jgi:hypothetical protein
VHQHTTTNNKQQTTTWPTTHNNHDKVRKNGIPYALGLTRSIAYPRNCLVNRNPDIVVEMTLHVGIKLKQKYLSYVRYNFLANGLKPVRLWPCVLRYVYVALQKPRHSTLFHGISTWFSSIRCVKVREEWPEWSTRTARTTMWTLPVASHKHTKHEWNKSF